MIYLKLAERFFITTLIFSVVISFFCKYVIDHEYLSNILVGFNIILFLVFLLVCGFKNKKVQLLIFIAFCLRVLLLYFDYYGRKIGYVLHSGGDSENFYNWAVLISEDLSKFKEISYTKYTDFLGLLYWFIGDQRLFSQFINLVLGMWSIFVFYNILDLLKLKESNKLLFLSLYCLYPHNIIFSSILLREALIQFFFIYSLLFFAKWLKSNDKTHIIKIIIFSLLGALFHQGMILGVVFYGFMFLYFDPHTHKFKFSFKNTILLVSISAVLFVLIMNNMSIITSKLSFLYLGDNLSLAEKFNARVVDVGGATYLTNFEVNSAYSFLILTPLRLIYFVFSPMPYDVRGAGSLIAILFDSSFYYFLVYKIVQSRKFLREDVQRIFPKLFVFLFLTIALGFGMATDNSGTAMRHRSKIFPALLVAVVFSQSIKQNKFAIWNDKTIL
jgi:hypothetical protein